MHPPLPACDKANETPGVSLCARHYIINAVWTVLFWQNTFFGAMFLFKLPLQATNSAKGHLFADNELRKFARMEPAACTLERPRTLQDLKIERAASETRKLTLWARGLTCTSKFSCGWDQGIRQMSGYSRSPSKGLLRKNAQENFGRQLFLLFINNNPTFTIYMNLCWAYLLANLIILKLCL